jgi:hypothetical protein
VTLIAKGIWSQNKSTNLVVALFVNFLPFNVLANAYSAELVPYVSATVGPDLFIAIESPTDVLRIPSMQIFPFCTYPCSGMQWSCFLKAKDLLNLQYILLPPSSCFHNLL